MGFISFLAQVRGEPTVNGAEDSAVKVERSPVAEPCTAEFIKTQFDKLEAISKSIKQQRPEVIKISLVPSQERTTEQKEVYGQFMQLWREQRQTQNNLDRCLPPLEGIQDTPSK